MYPIVFFSAAGGALVGATYGLRGVAAYALGLLAAILAIWLFEKWERRRW